MADSHHAFSLRIERSVQGLAALGSWVDAIAAEMHLAADTEFALRLCLEEAAANVVMHGVPGENGTAGFVMLRVEPVAETLRVTIEDRCRAFDPLQAPAPAMPVDLDNARVGGMGIHLMRHYARTLQYQHAEGINRLTLTLTRHHAGRTEAACRIGRSSC